MRLVIVLHLFDCGTDVVLIVELVQSFLSFTYLHMLVLFPIFIVCSGMCFVVHVTY